MTAKTESMIKCFIWIINGAVWTLNLSIRTTYFSSPLVLGIIPTAFIAATFHSCNIAAGGTNHEAKKYADLFAVSSLVLMFCYLLFA